jgi:hypothetical protein
MTQLVRSKFEIDNYLRRAWYINPAVNWPTPGTGAAQSSLFLTDKMIGLAVVTLRDSATGVPRARRLMSIASAGDGRAGLTVTMQPNRARDHRRAGITVTMQPSGAAERSAATQQIMLNPIQVLHCSTHGCYVSR